MDIFIEHLVKRKRTTFDFVKVILTLFLGLACIFIVSVVFIWIDFISSFVLVAVAGVVYIMYYLISSLNKEYEYSIVNSELDVDIIINARKRKNLCSVFLAQAKCFGTVNDENYKKYLQDKSIKKIFACEDLTDRKTKYIVFFKDDEKSMLLYTPNEKMLERIERYSAIKR